MVDTFFVFAFQNKKWTQKWTFFFKIVKILSTMLYRAQLLFRTKSEHFCSLCSLCSLLFWKLFWKILKMLLQHPPFRCDRCYYYHPICDRQASQYWANFPLTCLVLSFTSHYYSINVPLTHPYHVTTFNFNFLNFVSQS